MDGSVVGRESMDVILLSAYGVFWSSKLGIELLFWSVLKADFVGDTFTISLISSSYFQLEKLLI